jgi:signal peptidase I
MAPTLKGTTFETGDGLLLEKVSGWFRSPRRWEIYFFYNSEGTAVAKRIVGLPGEKISMNGKQLLVNGKPLAIPERLRFLKYYPFGNLTAGREVACGNGYFLLGDDSKDSYDSRFLGTVPKESFRGRVWLILRPWARVRSIS